MYEHIENLKEDYYREYLELKKLEDEPLTVMSEERERKELLQRKKTEEARKMYEGAKSEYLEVFGHDYDEEEEELTNKKSIYNDPIKLKENENNQNIKTELQPITETNNKINQENKIHEEGENDPNVVRMKLRQSWVLKFEKKKEGKIEKNEENQN